MIPANVAQVIETYPEQTRQGILALRDLILETAIAPLEETLRWGQPAYIAPKGTALRLGPHKAASFALYVHCQSTVIADYAATHGTDDRIDGNRAILFDTPDQIAPDRLRPLIQHALTYHH